MRRYTLDDPVLWRIGELVHEADLEDERYDAPPEAAGLDVIVRGLSLVRETTRLRSGGRLTVDETMTERPCPKDTTPEPSCARRPIDEELLARAAEINESVAGEFAERAVSPLENPVLERMAELGVETEAAVGVALQRGHGIAFYMRRGRTPRDRDELDSEARGLCAVERAQVAALAVAWWDGALTALRARDLERRRDAS